MEIFSILSQLLHNRHDQTAKFKFANILVSRFLDKIAKFFACQYFGVYSN